MSEPCKVADLFCGAGGFSKGFENSGKFSVTFGIDKSKECIKTFEANHVSAFAECNDIRNMHLAIISKPEVKHEMI